MGDNYILGIDIGTSSVKACLLNITTRKAAAAKRKEPIAVIESEHGPEGNKQHVPRILGTVTQCIGRFKKQQLAAVTKIAICGQMHGCLMWKCNPNGRMSMGEDERVKFDFENVGNMYTWLDSRCDEAFLRDLPVPNSHIPIAGGYGCATLTWLARNRSSEVANYDCAGTIQDFLVVILCGLQKPLMTVHNATSWGYFNTVTKEWNKGNLHQCGFPMSLLPDIVDVGTQAGTLQHKFCGIPEGTPVYAALGDLQCSVLPLITEKYEAAINISTSAQVCFLLPDGFQPPMIPPEPAQVIQELPFFDNKYLAVAASLNGGNTLKEFVIMLQDWMSPFVLTNSKKPPPREDIWKIVLQLGTQEEAESDLVIDPTIFGERSVPDRFGSITNIKSNNTCLGKVFRALCKGLINNLHSMMPSSVLQQHEIKRINGSGNALLQNKILQEELKLIYKDIPVEFKTGDAAFGAALAVCDI